MDNNDLTQNISSLTTENDKMLKLLEENEAHLKNLSTI